MKSHLESAKSEVKAQHEHAHFFFKTLTSYLHETVWNVWIGYLAAFVTVYELLRGFIQSLFLPPIPPVAYWTLGIFLLLIAPFRAFLKEKKRADIYETMSKQVFDETFVFLNFGKESRRGPRDVVEEGMLSMRLLNDIAGEVQAGNFDRAGMAVPLFYEMYNLVLDCYGGVGEGTEKYFNSARAIVDKVVAEGFPDRAISGQLRSEAYEAYRERWAGGKR